MENKRKLMKFDVISNALRSGLHTYEPVWTPEDNPEDEIKITDATMWIPMCQKSKENPIDLLSTWEKDTLEESLNNFYKKRIGRQFLQNKYCLECAVECFKEQIDELDYIPILEMFQSDTLEKTDDERFDSTE